MMVRGEVSRRGATPQELAINPEKFVTELSKRGINIREQYIFEPASAFRSIKMKSRRIYPPALITRAAQFCH